MSASSGWTATPGRMTARLLAAALGLESFVVFFAVLAASRLSSLPGTLIWLGGLGLMLAFILAAGLVRRPGGLVIAVVAQVLLVSTMVVVPAMGVIGLVFAAITWWLYSIGRRIDLARAGGAQADGGQAAGA